jgi:D-3-phosphoglycerate dehydrogenase
MARLVVTDSTFPQLLHEQAVASKHGLVFESHQCKNTEQVILATRGAEAVLVQFAPFGADVIRGLAPGATIVRYGVGYDNVDVRFAVAQGHRVCYVPDYCIEEVADHTCALVLAGLRKLSQLDASVRAGDWKAVAVCRPLKPFDVTTVGFVGMGRIGRAVMARLKAFGFQFLVADPMLGDDDAQAMGVRRLALDDLLAEADVVSLHVPSTSTTRGMINAASLAKMRAGALIVNCSRGDLIDETALASVLQSGHLGAALDVFREEPLPLASPLRDSPNLILTPHAAWYSERAIDRLQQLACDEIDRGMSGQPPRCPVPIAA